MEITFVGEPQWDCDRERVTIVALVGGREVVCGVSIESLMNDYGATGNTEDEAELAFGNNRAAIELSFKSALELNSHLAIREVDVTTKGTHLT